MSFQLGPTDIAWVIAVAVAAVALAKVWTRFRARAAAKKEAPPESAGAEST